ncbi:PBSX family phage terminase large subunit [Spirillospora sp. NPDC048911]|uniref:PBSX family phage terminase large subunit n=1 Tax=Spirillospora sp. NPDC048911 TaxID=3364527 RepID=UPI003716901D
MPGTEPLTALSPAQLRSVAGAGSRINVWHGAIRSGKTVASLLRWLIYLSAPPPGGLYVIAGRTITTVERNVLEPLRDERLFGPVARTVRHSPGAATATILGHKIHLIGAGDARAEERLRGMTCAGAYLDEATLLPEAFWTQLLGRMSVPGAQLFATTNPDSPGHWLKRRWLDQARELNVAAFPFTIDDNPSLSASYVETLGREYTGLWHRRFIRGEWCQAEGAVYEAWDPGRHVVTELPRIVRWLAVGCDYGTANPFSALLLGLGEDGRLYFVSEYRHEAGRARRQRTDEEYSADLRAWLGGVRRPHESGNVLGVEPEWVYVDPSAASLKVQLWRDGLTNVTDADNRVREGIRLVSSLLATDRLRVHADCAGWIGEVGGYSWDGGAAAKGQDAPVKVDDHSLDAGRYAIKSAEWAWRPLMMSTE